MHDKNHRLIRNSNVMLNKESREQLIFHSFVNVARLLVVPNSVRSVPPPAPDILCEIAGRGLVAFELVEIVTPAFNREMASGQKLEKSFEAESQKHPDLQHTFHDAHIYVGFFKTLPINQCLLAVPEIIALLVKQAKSTVGYIQVPDDLRKIVSVIEVHRGIHNGPIFDVRDMTKHTEELFTQLNIKCQTKTYVTQHPLELLAHYTSQPASDDLSCHDQVQQALAGSQFNRIWIFDGWSKAIKYVYPAWEPEKVSGVFF
jgi:hypothetical protein